MTTLPLHRIALGSFAALALASGPVFSESQYGSGTGTVTAQAHVNFSIVVPKMILLRVGSANTIDTLSWASTFAVTTGPATTILSSNQTANWDGATAPTATTAPSPTPGTPNTVAVSAWTNDPSGGSLGYTASGLTAATGPLLGNISVTAGTGLAHPTPLALATASTGAITFGTNTVTTGSWTYALGGTPATWVAGTYTGQVIYTATSL